MAASMATAYIAAHCNNLMDAVQFIAAFVNAPLRATFLLGMFWTRTRNRVWCADGGTLFDVRVAWGFDAKASRISH
jgi:solute:Na+ symporter, SSS family